ncbi:MAG TPA: signal recognition particle protein [Candidatus Caccalectryoclostridium excrementigallinarum]|uniref:Signal recognition particle protein n=1 Tax=Candidatus Caccalectryoclostridium excrementigallinarum TaxID=2840710 RepID=A0A9D1MMY8_9FIRM|nr:signal recognition particle protein [Candidatus Caccalectryoclostridium excrementigallinarum]
MGAFSGLSERLSHIFSKLKDKGKLTELEVKGAMREVRIALLEADVNLSVVKQFINNVSEKAVGEQVLKSLSPAQQVIAIVKDELTAVMGGTSSKLKVADKPPTIILMCGLQGGGKTTMCGKLAVMLRKQGKKPMLVACDIYRPAAIKQLQVVGKNADVPVFEMGQIDPQKIVKGALKEAESKGCDTLIVDTAGRLHIDDQLMDEIAGLKKTFSPDEILLVVDAMTGQDAVNVAKAFNDVMDVTGVVLTKLDGDTRGGAALSIRAVTGKPIKFCGTGEKLSDIEVFHPERMASRILGMGDVLTLIEKAQSAYTEEEAREMQRKMKEKAFTLEDYLVQIDKMKNMGDMSQMLGMIPGLAGKLKGQDLSVDENNMKKVKAMIQSMTPAERQNPDIIKGSHKKRIAAGSGTTIQDINSLLKQFAQVREMMSRMSNMGKRGFRMPF